MLTRRRRSALDTAEIELTLIASAAVMGDSSKLACRIYFCIMPPIPGPIPRPMPIPVP